MERGEDWSDRQVLRIEGSGRSLMAEAAWFTDRQWDLEERSSGCFRE